MTTRDESDDEAQRREKNAAAVVRQRLLGAIGTFGDLRFVDVIEKKTHPMTFCHTGGDERGTLVTARIWVAEENAEAPLREKIERLPSRVEDCTRYIRRDDVIAILDGAGIP